MMRIAHLLDDFGMGGVTRALTLFEEPALTRLATSAVVPVKNDALIAPRVQADLIVDHMALSWKRLVFLASLRARNPASRIVHVEHSYTRSFEHENIQAVGRFRAMLKLAAHLIDEFVCVSNAQADWLAQGVGIPSSKLTVIYPWTDRSELFELPEARPAFGRPVQLLAYGRYAPVKNFAALIEAMRAVPETMARLIIFGDGPDRASLEAMAAGLPSVTVLGPCHSPAAHLADCDAVVIPSRYEAFGLVATEARMAARPVLVASVDGLPEQVGSAGLSANMSTPDDILAAINAFTRLDLLSLGIAGRHEVRGQSDEIISRWTRLINRSASSAPKGGPLRLKSFK
ncbi:glycosyltransferase family 4 protein [Erythrobacter sp. R86502]|uniref:glycosyltransferase family 4 protein n=1 Tax=Erythrobacter sp. R86502 TaxID=3093846 RepID=UPI0036D3A3F1